VRSRFSANSDYRKDLIKRPGAYLIFRPLVWALIRGRRLIKAALIIKKIIAIDFSETRVKKFPCFIREKK